MSWYGALVGIAGDVALCWLSWRYIVMPRLDRFVLARVQREACLARRLAVR